MIFRFMIALLFICIFYAANGEAAIQITVYGDGLSCPNNCDSHVVFQNNLNGTIYAHDPSTRIQPFKTCEKDHNCEICFTKSAKECMTVMYRGEGPEDGRFDVTPNFIEQYCSKDSLGSMPEALATMCKQISLDANEFLGRTNCILHPNEPVCSEIIEKAEATKRDDQKKYDECKKLGGDKKFNEAKGRAKAEKRTHDCTYAESTPERKKKLGLRLLPAACPTNSYVGRDATDCCTGKPLADRAFGKYECSSFYLEITPAGKN